MSLTLVVGGARSGKSRFALSLAAAHGPRLGFIATLLPLTDEVASECRKLRAERQDAFVTWEEPVRVIELIAAHAEYFDSLVVDCFTGWLRNLAACNEGQDLALAAERFADIAQQAPAQIIAVSTEAPAALAESAAQIFQMNEGLPVRVK